MGYKGLSFVQTIFIFLASISVFDYGFGLAEAALGHGDDGILINKFLFTTQGLIGDLLQDLTLWGMMQFWGYCFFIVAICQLIKTFTVNVD